MLGIGEGSKSSIQQQIAGMGLNLVTVVPGSQQRGGVQFGASTMQSLKETRCGCYYFQNVLLFLPRLLK